MGIEELLECMDKLNQVLNTIQIRNENPLKMIKNLALIMRK